LGFYFSYYGITLLKSQNTFLYRVSATAATVLVASPNPCNSTYSNFLRNILDKNINYPEVFFLEIFKTLSFGSNGYLV